CLTLRNLQCDLASNTADGSLHLANACFACVARRDELDRIVGDLELCTIQSVFCSLARDQVTTCDFEFLAVAVACETDDLHAVAQGRRNRTKLVRSRDEEDLREIERQIEIVIAERIVLLWI